MPLVSCSFICELAPTTRRGFPVSSPSWVQVAHLVRFVALAAVDRQAGTWEQGPGRDSQGATAWLGFPPEGIYEGCCHGNRGPLRTMSMMQKRPMAFSGWAALLSTDAGAGATSLREPQG